MPADLILIYDTCISSPSKEAAMELRTLRYFLEVA